MSTKPTAQELQQAARELIESETFSLEINDFWEELTDRAAELASRRQEPEADRLLEMAELLDEAYMQFGGGYLFEESADALRAYAASLRSK